MEFVGVGACLVSRGNRIERLCRGIDYGCAQDPIERQQVVEVCAYAIVRRRYGSAEVRLPKRDLAALWIGVESVEAVSHGGDDQQVSCAVAGDIDPVDHQRLCIHLAVHGKGVELAKQLG